MQFRFTRLGLTSAAGSLNLGRVSFADLRFARVYS